MSILRFFKHSSFVHHSSKTFQVLFDTSLLKIAMDSTRLPLSIAVPPAAIPSTSIPTCSSSSASVISSSPSAITTSAQPGPLKMSPAARHPLKEPITSVPPARKNLRADEFFGPHDLSLTEYYFENGLRKVSSIFWFIYEVST